MPIAKAGTLLIPSGPSHDPDRRHMFVVCNDTDAGGLNLIVPVTSWTNNLCDATCRLDAHEHGYLRHASYVLYRNARIEPAKALLDGLASKVFTPHDPVNGQVFLKVKNGVCRSPQTPRKIKVYFGCP
jgi:hypothetical protein